MQVLIKETYTNGKITNVTDAKVLSVTSLPELFDLMFSCAVIDGHPDCDNEIVVTFPDKDKEIISIEIVNGYRD